MNDLKTGDIFVNPYGLVWRDNSCYYKFKIFEYREKCQGYQYSCHGNFLTIFWVYPEKNYQVTDEKIISLFKKGFRLFLVKNPEERYCDLKFNSIDELHEVIRNSYEFKIFNEL